MIRHYIVLHFDISPAWSPKGISRHIVSNEDEEHQGATLLQNLKGNKGFSHSAEANQNNKKFWIKKVIRLSSVET